MAKKTPKQPSTIKLHIVEPKPSKPLEVVDLTQLQSYQITNVKTVYRVLGTYTAKLDIDVLELLGLLERAYGKQPNPAEAERLALGLLALGATQKPKQPTPINQDLILSKLDRIQSLLESQPKKALADQLEWVSVKDFAKLIDRSEWYICEKFCKPGKVRCRKLDPMNKKSEWRILRSEAKRFKEEGFKMIVQKHDE